MYLATLDHLRKLLPATGGGTGGVDSDDDLERYLAAADGRIREQCPDRTLSPLPEPPAEGEEDPDPVALTFHTTGRIVQVPDLRVVESITVDGQATTDYRLKGRHGKPAWRVHLGGTAGAGTTGGFGFGPAIDDPVAALRGWAGREREVVILGQWGPPAVEPQVAEACAVWAARVWHQRQARFSDSRQDPEGGVQSYFRVIPPEIRATLDALKVPGA